MIIDYSILALLGILIGGVVIGFKWYWQYKLKAEKVYIKEQQEASKPENQIDTLIENLPAILADRQKLYEQAIMQDPNSPLAKSLKQQIDLMQMVNSIPQPVLQMGKQLILPIISKLGRFRL